MADPNPTSKPEIALPVELSDTSQPESSTSPAARRRVYEPTLLPPRKRLRVSPWIVIPGLLCLCAALLFFLVLAPHKRRFVPTAGEIVFVSDEGTPGHPHIWLARQDGLGAHRLTSGQAGDETAAAWSPDGAQIAFVSTRPGSDPQIFVADADGQNLIQVTHSGGGKSQPEFAPSDNTLIGYLSGGALNVADTTTGEASRVLPIVPEEPHAQTTEPPPPTASIVAFDWAPATKREQQGLAAVEEVNGLQALVVLPTLTAQAHDTRDGTPSSPPLAAANTLWLAWSPDGAVLALALQDIAGLPTGHSGSGLVLCDPLGNPTGRRPLAFLPSAATAPQNPVFSPDGSQVVFELWQGNDPAHQHSIGLFVVLVDGSAPPREIVRGSATGAHFSGDGRNLFFLRQRPDGGHDLYRAAADGTDLQRLSDGRADVINALLSPQTAPP